jgi:DNA repair protein RadA/Sms
LSSSFRTLDHVLGGGFVAGSTLLLSGDPGAGKSTLLLQVAAYVACRGYSAVYATAEEDATQVQLRAARLGLAAAPARLAATDDVVALLAALDSPETAPTLLVVDSLQRFRDPANPALPASPTQTRLVLAALIAHARRRQTITVIVSHVNKDNRASGTNDLQHDVDVLLHFSAVADRRVLRASKNRYGPTDVTATLRMTGEGVRE